MDARPGLLLAAALLSTAPTAARAADIPVPLPGASNRIDAIRQRGSLRVAVFGEYPWLKQNIGGGGAPFAGPAWLLAEEYARRLGVRLETVPVSEDNRLPILSGGEADITIAPLLETPARDRLVDFVTYSASAQCLFGLADNPKVARAGGVNDLNRPDITVAYATGTPQEAWLPGRLPRAGRRGVPGSSADALVDEVLAHRADIAPIDRFFFAGLARRVPGLVTLPKGDACLASQELPIPVGMAIGKQQPAFLAWLRAVAGAVKPEVGTEEMQVRKAGG